MAPIAKGRLVGAALLFALLAASGGILLHLYRAQEGRGGSPNAMAAYYCPMHPSMQSDRPVDCPICGMRMVRTPTRAGLPADKGGRSSTSSRVEGHAAVNIPPAKQQLI